MGRVYWPRILWVLAGIIWADGCAANPSESVVIDQFVPDKPAVIAGGQVTLTWSGENIGYCMITPGGIYTLPGTASAVVSPTDPTDYTLTCTGPNGPAVATVRVDILNPAVNVGCSAADAVTLNTTSKFSVEAVDSYPDGGFAAAGIASSAVVFGEGTVNENADAYHGGSHDLWAVKYGSDCSFQWRVPVVGSSTDTAMGVLAMPDGGLIVTGTTASPVTFGAGGSQESFSGWTGTRLYVARFDAAGELEWAHVLTDGSNGDSGWSLAPAPSGGFYLSGRVSARATFGAGEANPVQLDPSGLETQAYFFVARYNADSTFRWVSPVVKAYAPSLWPTQRMQSVSVNPAGQIAAAGYQLGCPEMAVGTVTCDYTLIPGPNEQLYGQSGGTWSGYVAVVSSDGDGMWAEVIESDSGNSAALQVAWTPDGGVLAGGYFGKNGSAASVDLNGTSGPVSMTAAGSEGDTFILRFEEPGTVAWTSRISCSWGEDILGLFSLIDSSVVIDVRLACSAGIYTNELLTDTVNLYGSTVLMLDPDGYYYSTQISMPPGIFLSESSLEGRSLAAGTFSHSSISITPPGLTLTAVTGENRIAFIRFNP